MLSLPFVETMITQACNLSCQGCTNYSDLRHSGYVPWSQGRGWIQAWSDRLVIEDFGIMGGEPLINPEALQWLLGVRSMLPSAQIRFTTNGLLLHKHPGLLDLCQDLGNIVFKITIHVQDPELERTIERIMESRSWQQVTEHGITRWRSHNGLRFQVNRPQRFLPPFRNQYHDMAPWNSNPAEAFARCIQQTCPLLYKGRIYKCSTSALLMDTLDRFGRPNWQQWQPYINQGIAAEDSEETIEAFVKSFGQSETICAQCPGQGISDLDHLATVKIHKA